MPVLPVLPTHKYFTVNNLRWHPQHGMEEVIGFDADQVHQIIVTT
jgi:hypothetical protein